MLRLPRLDAVDVLCRLTVRGFEPALPRPPLESCRPLHALSIHGLTP